MIQSGTLFGVTDKTSVVLGRCLKVFGSTGKFIANLGDVVLVAVVRINNNRVKFMKPRLRKRYRKGTMHRALMVRTKVNYCRFPGSFVRFSVNSGVLVTIKVIPVSNRAYGPLIKELCMKWPSLGCVSRVIV